MLDLATLQANDRAFRGLLADLEALAHRAADGDPQAAREAATLARLTRLDTSTVEAD